MKVDFLGRPSPTRALIRVTTFKLLRNSLILWFSTSTHPFTSFSYYTSGLINTHFCVYITRSINHATTFLRF